MKQVDQRVSEIEAKAYVQSMITEHSFSPAPNNWVIVPAVWDKREGSEDANKVLFWDFRRAQKLLTDQILQITLDNMKHRCKMFWVTLYVNVDM